MAGPSLFGTCPNKYAGGESGQSVDGAGQVRPHLRFVFGIEQVANGAEAVRVTPVSFLPPKTPRQPTGAFSL